MQLISYNLSAFGSRFNLTFDPSRQLVNHGALGRTFDAPAQVLMGVQTDGFVPETFRYLPFASPDAALSENAALFELMDMQTTMTSVTFCGKSIAARVQLKVTFTSPFYPGDVRLTVAPFFYVDVEVSRLDHRLMWLNGPKIHSDRGKVVFKVSREGLLGAEGNSLAVAYDTPVDNYANPSGEPVTPAGWGAEAEKHSCRDIIRPLSADITLNPDTLAFEIPYDLSGDQRVKKSSFVWAAYCGEEILETLAGKRRLKYTEFFDSPESVADYAAVDERQIRRQTRLFDSVVRDASLSLNQKNLLAQSFQSYALNTVWAEPKGDEHDWFSVWEGNCFYNGTLDVEYNNGLFYYAFWPDLLSWSFDEWAQFEQTDEHGSYLSHDIGRAYHVTGPEYHHAMECEENCNFLLMLHAFARVTPDGRKDAMRHEALSKRLARYLIDADTTGDGIPNHGTANTIDDATPAVQYARKSTYLGVKTLCALKSVERMAELYWEDMSFAKICRDRAALIAGTIESKAWLGDHYAVCLDKTDQFQYFDAWTGDEVRFEDGHLPGWDAYSLYFSNGLLYWMLSGESVSELGLDAGRALTDLRNSLVKSLTEYGCTHSSSDRASVWVSQNLWRDCISLFLEAELDPNETPAVDLRDMADRYWSLQVLFNSNGFSKGFIDTYYANDLSIYPRGLTCVGWLLTMPLKMRLGDKFADLLECDWGNEKVAWIRWNRAFVPDKVLVR